MFPKKRVELSTYPIFCSCHEELKLSSGCKNMELTYTFTLTVLSVYAWWQLTLVIKTPVLVWLLRGAFGGSGRFLRRWHRGWRGFDAWSYDRGLVVEAVGMELCCMSRWLSVAYENPSSWLPSCASLMHRCAVFANLPQLWTARNMRARTIVKASASATAARLSPANGAFRLSWNVSHCGERLP